MENIKQTFDLMWLAWGHRRVPSNLILVGRLFIASFRVNSTNCIPTPNTIYSCKDRFLTGNKRTYMVFNLFISHSWSYGDAYDRLVKMLDSAPRFEYRDYSVPKDDPIHDADNATQLRAAITAQMKPASVILIMAGKYATYSKWIKEEISIAQNGFTIKKSIIAITPWGAQQISSVVQEAADEISGWNTNSIVNAIRNQA